MSISPDHQQEQDTSATFQLPGATETETNQSASFSTSEDQALEAAREALATEKRSFERWLVIGRGVKILRQRADLLNLGRKTFARLMEEQGFKMDGPKPGRQFDKSTVTRLLQVMEREREVIEWHRKKLTPTEQIAWASPNAIIRHCPIFAKPKDPDTSLSPFEKLKQVNLDLQERLHRAEEEIKRGGGDLWTKDDRPEDIAAIMLSKLSPTKAERVARAMLEAVNLSRRRKSATTAAGAQGE